MNIFFMRPPDGPSENGSTPFESYRSFERDADPLVVGVFANVRQKKIYRQRERMRASEIRLNIIFILIYFIGVIYGFFKHNFVRVDCVSGPNGEQMYSHR